MTPEQQQLIVKTLQAALTTEEEKKEEVKENEPKQWKPFRASAADGTTAKQIRPKSPAVNNHQRGRFGTHLLWWSSAGWYRTNSTKRPYPYEHAHLSDYG